MIDVLASEPQYRDHLLPIAAGLGVPVRGIAHHAVDGRMPLALIASHRDQTKAREVGYTRFARIEHGVGQSYGGDPGYAHHQAYPGGKDANDVELFLMPNEQAARRWREAYPAARVEVIGSPHLDSLPERSPHRWHDNGDLCGGSECLHAIDGDHPRIRPAVAVSFHWDYRDVPEGRSAMDEYLEHVVRMARHGVTVLGHGHPRLFRRGIANTWRAYGIRAVPDFADVIREADLYVCDNSSTMYEAAARGIPVLALNSVYYRRPVHHGLRFWDAVPGLQVDRPSTLARLVDIALEDPPEAQALRAHAVAEAFAYPSGATDRAVAALLSWAGG